MPSTYVYGRGRNNSRSQYACHDKQAMYDAIMSNDNSSRHMKSDTPAPKPEPEVPPETTDTPVEVVYVERPLFTLENIIKFSFWKNFFGF